MTDAYKKSRDVSAANYELAFAEYDRAIGNHVMTRSQSYRDGFDVGYNFALNSSEVNALVEALTSVHDELVERHNVDSSDWHSRYHIKDIEKALAAFQKARDAQKAEGEK